MQKSLHSISSFWRNVDFKISSLCRNGEPKNFNRDISFKNFRNCT